jgi:4-phytase/acid phosphatase
LVFELWKRLGTAEYSVRTFYTAQTLDQMRNSTPLGMTNPPERAPVFVPGCGQADGTCTWNAFKNAVESGIK